MFIFAPLSFEQFEKVVKEIPVQKGTKNFIFRLRYCLTDEKEANRISKDSQQMSHNHEEYDPQTIKNEQVM